MDSYICIAMHDCLGLWHRLHSCVPWISMHICINSSQYCIKDAFWCNKWKCWVQNNPLGKFRAWAVCLSWINFQTSRCQLHEWSKNCMLGTISIFVQPQALVRRRMRKISVISRSKSLDLNNHHMKVRLLLSLKFTSSSIRKLTSCLAARPEPAWDEVFQLKIILGPSFGKQHSTEYCSQTGLVTCFKIIKLNAILSEFKLALWACGVPILNWIVCLSWANSFASLPDICKRSFCSFNPTLFTKLDLSSDAWCFWWISNGRGLL